MNMHLTYPGSRFDLQMGRHHSRYSAYHQVLRDLHRDPLLLLPLWSVLFGHWQLEKKGTLLTWLKFVYPALQWTTTSNPWPYAPFKKCHCMYIGHLPPFRMHDAEWNNGDRSTYSANENVENVWTFSYRDLVSSILFLFCPCSGNLKPNTIR